MENEQLPSCTRRPGSSQRSAAAPVLRGSLGLQSSCVGGCVLSRTVYLMKLPRLEKKIRVGLRWVLDVVFERDLAQYINARDVELVNRLLETARQPHGAPSPELSARGMK